MRGWCCVLVVVASCGSPDPTTGDAGQDAAHVDASAVGPVTITVYDNAGAAAPNQAVVFLAADGSLVVETVTDAQGNATAMMAAGGSVTAQRPHGVNLTDDWINTYTGVKPGDHLFVGTAATTLPPTFSTTFSLPAKTGATAYYVNTTCGDGTSSGTTIVASLSCTTTDAFVTARENGLVVAEMFVTGLAASSGGTIDLTGQTWRGFKTVTVTFDGLPTGLEQAYIFGVPTVPAPLSSWLGTVTLTTQGNQMRAVTTLDVYDLPNLDVLYNLRAERPSPVNQHVLTRQAGAQDVSVDVTGTLLPWFTTPWSFSAATNAITWTEAAGAPADYARMTIAVTRPGISQFRWELAGPPGPGTFALPMLPGSFATYNLQASDSLEIRGYLRSAPGGWDRSRSCALQPDCYFLPLALGAHAVASSPLTIVP